MKNYSIFITRVLSMALIIGVLVYYNGIAADRQAMVQAREAEIEAAEAHNAAILAAQQESSQQASVWTDGTYEGTGTGFGGDIVLSLTIADSKISRIEVVSASGEDAAYFSMAQELLDRIVKKQSADVDTVSGATFSSHGIIDAVTAALQKAEG